MVYVYARMMSVVSTGISFDTPMHSEESKYPVSLFKADL